MLCNIVRSDASTILPVIHFHLNVKNNVLLLLKLDDIEFNGLENMFDVIKVIFTYTNGVCIVWLP
jgi:hypothetical protein